MAVAFSSFIEFVVFWLSFRNLENIFHPLVRDEFGVCVESAGGVKHVSHMGSGIARDVSHSFDLAEPHTLHRVDQFADAEFFPCFYLKYPVDQQRDEAGQEMCFYALFPSQVDRT